MAQRRVTSSVTRRGADAPQLCSIFLPAKFWPARIADQSAVRAGAGGGTWMPPSQRLLADNFLGELRSWTRCRAGLLRLWSGRMWVRIPPGPHKWPVAQWIERLMFPGRLFPFSSFEIGRAHV